MGAVVDALSAETGVDIEVEADDSDEAAMDDMDAGMDASDDLDDDADDDADPDADPDAVLLLFNFICRLLVSYFSTAVDINYYHIRFFSCSSASFLRGS